MQTTPRPLDGKAALVTGGGSGIGLACAQHLLRDGATVTIVGRSADRLRDAAATLMQDAPSGAEVRFVACDVTDEAAVESAVHAAAGPDGLHIAVANAGGGAIGSVLTTSLAEWRFTLDVNLTGSFLTLKHAGKAMTHGGTMVAVSSIAGVLTHRFMSAYCASKAGLEMLVRCAADELGGLGIRVNAIRPGLVPTELSTVLTTDQVIVDDYMDQMPLARLGTTEDIAAAVRWLAGPESGWVTGQCISIDGGHHLRRGPRIDTLVELMLGPDIPASIRPR